MIVVLVGESASGKSTIEKMIENRDDSFTRIISYTTRPRRAYEKDGTDYCFSSKEFFEECKKNDIFLEYASYAGWEYGSMFYDYEKPGNHIVVMTPHGCRLLKKWARESGIKVISFYINVDRRSRMIKILERGDDIDEAYRRNLSDVGQFDGFADEADFVIENDNYKKNIEEIYDEVYNIISSQL